MTRTTPVKLRATLQEARLLIAHGGWAQGQAAERGDGFDLMAAIRAASAHQDVNFLDVYDLMLYTCATDFLTRWNDAVGRTPTQVLRKLCEAERLSEWVEQW